MDILILQLSWHPQNNLLDTLQLHLFWAVLNWKSKPRGVLQNKILGLEPEIFLGNSAVWGVYGGLDPRILFSGEASWSGSQQVLLLDGQEVGTLLILFFACVSRNMSICLVSTVVIARKDYLTATVNMQHYHVLSIIMDLLCKTVVLQANRPS
jgi:hypothetical protein